MSKRWNVALSVLLHGGAVGLLAWASRVDSSTATWGVLGGPVLFVFGALFGRLAMVTTRRHIATGVVLMLVGGIGYLVILGSLVVGGMFGETDPMGIDTAFYIAVSSLAFAWGLALLGPGGETPEPPSIGP